MEDRLCRWLSLIEDREGRPCVVEEMQAVGHPSLPSLGVPVSESGLAKLSSWPSGSVRWKKRSPQGASAGAVSGFRPAATARAWRASTSETWKITRPHQDRP